VTRLRDLTARDGTRLRWWDNEVTGGQPVVVSNGLGASPAAWPFLDDPAGRYHAVTWHHRGLGGSDRPADERRITLDDHADDLLAVMDAAGMASALLVGWSVGVGVALEVARRAPERVEGLMLLGGGAGGGFRVLPARTPEVVQRGVSRASAWLLRVVGPPISGVISVLPRGLDAMGEPGAVLTAPPIRTLAEVAREFARHDWTWFSRMVLAAGEHEPIPTDEVRVPVTVLAGEFDSIAPADEMAALAAALPDARLVRVPGSHFLPLQYPELLRSELDDLARRSRR
jgi:3-oxoadipate enol-lactonase